jgi:hypothetical protein
MTEPEFWEALRLRINCEPGLPGYCDWITPKRYILSGSSPRVVGRVGFVNRAEECDFAVYLKCEVASSDEIDWVELVPSNWLAILR